MRSHSARRVRASGCAGTAPAAPLVARTWFGFGFGFVFGLGAGAGVGLGLGLGFELGLGLGLGSGSWYQVGAMVHSGDGACLAPTWCMLLSCGAPCGSCLPSPSLPLLPPLPPPLPPDAATAAADAVAPPAAAADNATAGAAGAAAAAAAAAAALVNAITFRLRPASRALALTLALAPTHPWFRAVAALASGVRSSMS
eukprot:scaffold47561_cov58-Phaeocystis_antarctica.AAC.6